MGEFGHVDDVVDDGGELALGDDMTPDDGVGGLLVDSVVPEIDIAVLLHGNVEVVENIFVEVGLVERVVGKVKVRVFDSMFEFLPRARMTEL